MGRKRWAAAGKRMPTIARWAAQEILGLEQAGQLQPNPAALGRGTQPIAVVELTNLGDLPSDGSLGRGNACAQADIG